MEVLFWGRVERVGRIRDQARGSRSLGACLWRLFLVPFPSHSASCERKWDYVLPHAFASMVFCLSVGPESWMPRSMDIWNFCNGEPKQVILLFQFSPSIISFFLFLCFHSRKTPTCTENRIFSDWLLSGFSIRACCYRKQWCPSLWWQVSWLTSAVRLTQPRVI